MEIVKQTILDRRGEIAPHMAVILLVGMILLSTALEINRIFTTVNQVIDKTNAAVLSVAAYNVAEVSAGVREGVGTARKYTDSSWTHLVSTSDVANALCTSLGVVRNNDALELESGAYRILELNTRYVNLEDGKLNFTTTLTLEIRLSLGGKLLPAIKKPLEVHSTYEAKY